MGLLKPRSDRGHEQGFASNELLMALGILAVLGWIGIGVTALFDLPGWLAIAPPATFVLWAVCLNVVEALRARKRR